MKSAGTPVRAAELSGHGGEVLKGPRGGEVHVLKVVTHKASPHRFVRFRTATSMLEVTQDHRVIVEGPSITLTAGQVRTSHRVMTGADCFENIQAVEAFDKTLEVVEVFLKDDAQVLAWTPMAQRMHAAKFDRDRAFVVRGGVDALSHHVQERNTFVDVSHPGAQPELRRTRSLDWVLSKKDNRRLQYNRARLFPRLHAEAAQL